MPDARNPLTIFIEVAAYYMFCRTVILYICKKTTKAFHRLCDISTKEFLHRFEGKTLGWLQPRGKHHNKDSP
jgi:hypothetical protein